MKAIGTCPKCHGSQFANGNCKCVAEAFRQRVIAAMRGLPPEAVVKSESHEAADLFAGIAYHKIAIRRELQGPLARKDSL